jgi:D-glycero-D-manno-heptose 1,7-bisphosphate phosphatase
VKRAAFLDRDGVINKTILVEGAPRPPKSVEEVSILNGASEAITLLKKHNYLPVVITNQPDIARGSIEISTVTEINQLIGNSLGIENFYMCIHDDSDLCACRKPLTGLIDLAALELNLNVPNSFLVGDRWRDIEAGQKAGCNNFFIDYSYSEREPKKPFTRVSSLLEAVEIMTGEKNGTN